MAGARKSTGKSVSGFGIKLKLTGVMLPLAALVIGIILFLIYTNVTTIVSKKSEQILTVSSENVRNQVGTWMAKTITALETERDAIEYFSLNSQSELEYIKHTAGQYDAFPAGIYLATTGGKLIHGSFVPGPEFDLFKKPWYIDGLKSEDFIWGSVYFDEDSQSYVVGASGILKNKDGSVRGVAAADIYLDAISQIVKGVSLEQTGGVFLVDTLTNTIIGHKDDAMAGTILSDQKDSMYQFADSQIREGAYGLSVCEDQNTAPVYIDIEKVPGSPWVAVAYVPRAEVMRDLNVLSQLIFIIALGGIFLLAVIIIFIVRHVIIRPVREIDYTAAKIADGDLNQRITYSSRDEFGVLASNFNKTVEKLRTYVDYIDEISRVLNEISRGNLDFSLTYDYTGEFSRVKTSMEQISFSLNNTLSQINRAAGQVTAGAEQVSAGAQGLSQGTTEQASSVEELAATIIEISNQISQNASTAQEAKSMSDEVSSEIIESDHRMQEMILAIKKISNQSSEIGKIIKIIEDISFQTNILALNAAVEAARAGAAGKGFAVVADEVRNLANRSAEAAKNTADLIEETIRAVENGETLAGQTAQSMRGMVENSKLAASLMDKISTESGNQAASMKQVTIGIEQISGVVQANSATAEQSAAASEVMTEQARTLKQLVDQFQLKNQ